LGAPFILKLRTTNKRMIMTMMRSTHLHTIRKRVVVRKNKFKQARITFKRKIKFLKRLSKLLRKSSKSRLRKNSNKRKPRNHLSRRLQKRKRNKLLSRLKAPP
jgi:hypothetical protein